MVGPVKKKVDRKNSAQATQDARCIFTFFLDFSSLVATFYLLLKKVVSISAA